MADTGPFTEWVNRALQIAARSAKNDLAFRDYRGKRIALQDEVNNLYAAQSAAKKEGKTDEAGKITGEIRTKEAALAGMKPEFDALHEVRRAVASSAKMFRDEFRAAHPTEDDQRRFTTGIEARALQNMYRTRSGGDVLNLASKMVWVVCPWRRVTFAFIRGREVAGLNVTEITGETLSKVIPKMKRFAGELERELIPDIDSAVAGDADASAFNAKDQEDLDSLLEDVNTLEEHLKNIKASAERRRKAKSEEQRLADEFTAQGEPAEPDELMLLEEHRSGLEKQIQGAAGRGDYKLAGKFQSELEDEVAPAIEKLKAARKAEQRIKTAEAIEEMSPPMPGEGEPFKGNIPKVSSGVMVGAKPAEEVIAETEAKIAGFAGKAGTLETEAASFTAEADKAGAAKDYKTAAAKAALADQKIAEAQNFRKEASALQKYVDEIKAAVENAIAEKARTIAAASKTETPKTEPAVVVVGTTPAPEAAPPQLEKRVRRAKPKAQPEPVAAAPGTAAPNGSQPTAAPSTAEDPRAVIAREIARHAAAGNTAMVTALTETLKMLG